MMTNAKTAAPWQGTVLPVIANQRAQKSFYILLLDFNLYTSQASGLRQLLDVRTNRSQVLPSGWRKLVFFPGRLPTRKKLEKRHLQPTFSTGRLL